MSETESALVASHIDALIAFAKSIQADPDLFGMFQRIGTEGWLTEDESARLHLAQRAFTSSLPEGMNPLALSAATSLLRRVAAADLAGLDGPEARAHLREDPFIKSL